MKKLWFVLFILFSLNFLYAEDKNDTGENIIDKHMLTENKTNTDDANDKADKDKKTEPTSTESAINTNDENSEKVETTKDSPDKEKTPDKEVDVENGSSVFSLINKSGLILAENDKWYYEKYNEKNLPVLAVLYEKDKLIEKKEWTYENDLLIEFTITKDDEVAVEKYNQQAKLIEVTNTKSSKVISKKTYEYTADGKLSTLIIVENKIVRKLEIEYDGSGLKKKERNYKNGEMISLIEYTNDKKTIHLFHQGKEISVFDEKVKNDKR